MAYGDHGVEQSLVEVAAEAAYFAGRGHVYAQHRIGLVQTGE